MKSKFQIARARRLAREVQVPQIQRRPLPGLDKPRRQDSGVIVADVGLQDRTCLRCGCTEDNACVTRAGACAWACEAIDVCTACVKPAELALFDDIADLEAAMEPLQRLHYARCVQVSHELLKNHRKGARP